MDINNEAPVITRDEILISAPIQTIRSTRDYAGPAHLVPASVRTTPAPSRQAPYMVAFAVVAS
jgi:hypothetical protein